MDTFRCKNKVLAYITRNTNNGLEILAFTHRDYPEAGLQVPGGTLDESEEPLTGVLREVREETGLEKFSSSVLLGATEYVAAEKKEIHLRSFFQLAYDEVSEMTFTHTVSAGEDDSGLVFLYRWAKLENLPELAAEQGALLSKIQLRQRKHKPR